MSCRWTEEEINEAIWEELEPLLPAPKPRRNKHTGRKPQDPRSALGGILFVLRHNLAWNKLPMALGFGCGSACRKRLSGVARRRSVDQAARRLALALTRRRADRLEPGGGRRQQPARAQKGDLTGPNPTDRARAGSKHHLLTDANGVPLAALTTAANRNEVTMLLPLLAAVPPVKGRRGRPQRKPKEVYADRAYRSRAHRKTLAAGGTTLHVAPPGAPHGSGLGRHRWVVERTFAWLHQFEAAENPLRTKGRPPPGIPHPGLLRHLCQDAFSSFIHAL